MDTPLIDHLPPIDWAGNPLRVAFFDVDGTLLDRDGHLSDSTCTAIAALKARGVRTAFATGRPPFAVGALQQRLKLDGPHVFYTGALCHFAGAILADQCLVPAQWRAVVEEATACDVHCEIYYEDHYCTAYESDIVSEHARHLGVKPHIVPADQWPLRPAYKLLLGVDTRRVPAGLLALEAQFTSLHFAYAHLPSRPHWQFASVVAGSVNKTGLFDSLLARLGHSAGSVVAFGDGGSDMAFLQAAGLGIAMGNASAQVQAAANFVTRSSCEDGVAYAISRLLARA